MCQKTFKKKRLRDAGKRTVGCLGMYEGCFKFALREYRVSGGSLRGAKILSGGFKTAQCLAGDYFTCILIFINSY